ncbi:MAG: L-threonylcarbamoyladenylate synthase [Acidimicrobiales bacterium]
MTGAHTELADAIRSGPVVVQTETVFGLACLPTAEMVDRVFEAKARPAHLNLPVIIGDPDQLAALGIVADDCAEALIEAFWPGALTLAFAVDPHAEGLPWLDGRDEVAVRIPAVDPLRELARQVGPFLMTSANRHGEPPVASAEEARAVFGEDTPVFEWPDVDPPGPLPSTLVNVGRTPPVIERVGALSVEMIRRVCPSAVVSGESGSDR